MEEKRQRPPKEKPPVERPPIVIPPPGEKPPPIDRFVGPPVPSDQYPPIRPPEPSPPPPPFPEPGVMPAIGQGALRPFGEYTPQFFRRALGALGGKFPDPGVQTAEQLWGMLFGLGAFREGAPAQLGTNLGEMPVMDFLSKMTAPRDPRAKQLFPAAETFDQFMLPRGWDILLKILRGEGIDRRKSL